MDEDNEHEVYEAIRPVRHDKWSVLILALSWAHKTAQVTADTMFSATITAAQHASQREVDRKFEEITRG